MGLARRGGHHALGQRIDKVLGNFLLLVAALSPHVVCFIIPEISNRRICLSLYFVQLLCFGSSDFGLKGGSDASAILMVS